MMNVTRGRMKWQDEQRRNEQHRTEFTIETHPLAQPTQRTEPEFQREDAVFQDLRGTLWPAEVFDLRIWLRWINRLGLPVLADELLHALDAVALRRRDEGVIVFHRVEFLSREQSRR